MTSCTLINRTSSVIPVYTFGYYDIDYGVCYKYYKCEGGDAATVLTAFANPLFGIKVGIVHYFDEARKYIVMTVYGAARNSVLEIVPLSTAPFGISVVGYSYDSNPIKKYYTAFNKQIFSAACPVSRLLSSFNEPMIEVGLTPSYRNALKVSSDVYKTNHSSLGGVIGFGDTGSKVWVLRTIENQTYLGFRGTITDGGDYRNIIINAGADHYRLSLHNPDYAVHGGYECAVRTMFHEICQCLELRNVGNFVCVGHSMGGGLAQIFALLYLNSKPDTCQSILSNVITFAAPMVFWNMHDSVAGADIAAMPNDHRLRDWSNLCTNVVCDKDLTPLLPRVLSNTICAQKLSSNSGYDIVASFFGVNDRGFLARNFQDMIHYSPPGHTVILFSNQKAIRVTRNVFAKSVFALMHFQDRLDFDAHSLVKHDAIMEQWLNTNH